MANVQIVDIVFVDAGKLLLVQQRKPSAYGKWSFPGGHVELGETLDEALRREVMEELGVDLQSYSYLKTYVLVRAGGDLDIHTYTGDVTGINRQIKLKDDELLAYGWFTLESLGTLGSSLRAPEVLDQARDALASQNPGM